MNWQVGSEHLKPQAAMTTMTTLSMPAAACSGGNVAGKDTYWPVLAEPTMQRGKTGWLC
ncbi:hypothetical protein GGTG_12897 [Gaeumannomyces tritici R3-111a-1]|uniref:Uncharacterized protein n=1 Tax=Gaeumannomyces tritici (strain R3-111a-1) TaxID=644352 RepID=J3PHB8_GAET3|nr:hypothetical protein GGTG_12897 [Gaeumannomyces tritici R3-111a-1]EJT69278.1 hypothetical protein GGTG_12897 [Gaeumannomyces tritici R3-111a-1]